ncbi:hypothetical protein GCM10023187_34430 [Nibrella viscosa]|uniref:Gliding motility-associated C-terminal domain-containing protein n=1 Tax=Nibrella viscosa TaxID=1084524 RepID=A0ABP8KN32_9BACT
MLAQDLCDKAQRPANSVEGGFTVNVTRGCAPLTVRVTNTKTAATSVKYFYEYTANANIATGGLDQTSYTYTKPGKYRILQAGSLSGTGMLFCQEIEVFDTPLVDFTPQACAGRVVIVDFKLTDETRKYDKIRISWGDGTPFQDLTIAEVATQTRIPHTYTSNGNYSVTVLGLYNGINCGGSSTKQVTVGATASVSQPVVTALTARDDKTILLQYQFTGSAPIELHQKDAGGNFVATGQNSTASSGTFTISTDARKEQCFRLVTKDVCGNAIASEDICSIVTTAVAEKKQNSLSWNTYSGSGTFLRYRIFRNGGAAPITNIAARATGAYIDTDNIDCNTQYCYTVVAEINNPAAPGGRTSITSAPTCVTGLGTGDIPGDVRSTLVSVEDNYPRLVMTGPAVGTTPQYSFAIGRADSPNGPFRALNTIQNTNVFRDETAQPSKQSYCYQVTYQNNCGLKSNPSAPVCTVWLTSKTATAIDWTADSPFFPQNVAFYTVEFIDSLGRQARQQMNVGGNTHFEPDLDDPRLQAVRFRIIANSANGSVSYSNFFELRQNARIFAPDVFTPNGDGQNEEFKVVGKYWKKFSLTIFNRWGEPIFTTTEAGRGWNGMINGQLAEPGNYIYRVEIEDNTGVQSVKRGSFLLMR